LGIALICDCRELAVEQTTRTAKNLGNKKVTKTLSRKLTSKMKMHTIHQSKFTQQQCSPNPQTPETTNGSKSPMPNYKP